MRKLNLNQPEQRTYDWHRARLGNWTGSEIYKLMGKGRSKSEKFSETAKSYIIKVLSERMLNADVVDNGTSGVNGSDGLAVQMYDAKLIKADIWPMTSAQLTKK